MTTTPAPRVRIFACPAHAPIGVPAQPYDDGAPSCSVCGKANYAVKPFELPAYVVARGWRAETLETVTARLGTVMLATLPPMSLDPHLARSLRTAGQKVAEWTAERDRLVREAVEAGGSLREVGEAAGLSHTAVKFIAHGRPTKPAADKKGEATK